MSELEELRRRARIAENRFEQAFHGNAAAMVIASRTDLRILDVNPRWLQLFGATREQVIGKTTRELGLITEENARQRIEAHRAQPGGYDIELDLTTFRGDAITVHASAKPIELEVEGPCTLTTLIDITELKRYERDLRELNEELERRVKARTVELESTNRDLEGFTSSVSHDLRAPLRTIHGFSEALLEDFRGQLPDKAVDLLTRIHAGGQRLRSLVDDLLAFSRVGRHGVKRGALDLDALVASVCEELLAGRGVGDRLVLRVLPLGSCHADPTLLRAVWTNLVDNALKYSRNQPRIEIEIGKEQREGDTVYYIQDNGVGFDPAQADQLFGVFQRLHSAAEFEGTGIGLANVRRIVERHHGWITASSAVGKGARFEFTLGLP